MNSFCRFRPFNEHINIYFKLGTIGMNAKNIGNDHSVLFQYQPVFFIDLTIICYNFFLNNVLTYKKLEKRKKNQLTS